MRWLISMCRSVWGLFIDDGWLAVSIVLWLGLAWWALPLLSVPVAWRGAVLFLGLAGILTVSVVRRAR